jgi:signal transduction histidine kinase
VRKFLDLSRIEKGELDVKRTELSLREDVFDVCLETFSAEIAEKQIQVTNNIQLQMNVYGDIDLLRVAANNLISNAIKYGLDRGKIALSSEDQGSRVQVEVYNDSIPIKEDERARLFKRFSRLEAKADKKSKGTGLGLFITREIILKHGGDIWVEPKENGNSFIFQIEKDREIQ